MKKIVSTLLLVAAFVMGGLSSFAQLRVDMSDVQPMTSENQALADAIMETQLSDPDAANKQFAKLLKKIQKDPEQLTAAGKFFVDNKVYPCAKQCAELVYKLKPDYIPGLKLSAAVGLMRRGESGLSVAGQKMDEILNYDPNNLEALRLAARIYKYINPYAAKDYLNKMLEVEAGNIVAYKEIGDINYESDDFQDAVENYDKFFAGSEVRREYALSYDQYLNSLFALGQKTRDSKYYMQILDVCDKVDALQMNSIVTKRMRFFANVELGREAELEKTSEYLLSKAYSDSAYIYRDYAYGAVYLRDKGDVQGAISLFQKGLERDTAQYVAYKEISKLYRKLKDGDKAIEAQATYLAKKEAAGAKVDLTDERDLVLCYLAAKNAASSAEAKTAYAEKGDVICQKMIELKPDSYQGWYYRADLWMMDRQSAEQKPYQYYLKALENLEKLDEDSKESYGSQIAVAATYAAFYHYNNKNFDQCKTYAQKALKYDPTNSTSQALLKACK